MRGRRLVLALTVGLLLPNEAIGALELSTDHRAVSFGVMKPGEEKTLSQSGSFHNEITCASTGGVAWYVKISLLQPLSAGGEIIPPEALQWQLTQTDGHGSVSSQNQFRNFSLAPDLVYISASDEAAGTPVHFQFRYALTLPEAQVAGVYQTTIRLTLTEVL